MNFDSIFLMHLVFDASPELKKKRFQLVPHLADISSSHLF